MGNPKKNGRVDVWRASRRDNIYPEYTDIREKKKEKDKKEAFQRYVIRIVRSTIPCSCTRIEICPCYPSPSVCCMIDSPYLIPPYTLRIRTISRIGGTIYRNERKTDARFSECPEWIRYATVRRDFLKRHPITPPKLKVLVHVNGKEETR